MELNESQIETIASTWGDPVLKDLLQKVMLIAARQENIPLKVGEMLQLFEGMDTLLTSSRERESDLNANV